LGSDQRGTARSVGGGGGGGVVAQWQAGRRGRGTEAEQQRVGAADRAEQQGPGSRPPGCAGSWPRRHRAVAHKRTRPSTASW